LTVIELFTGEINDTVGGSEDWLVALTIKANDKNKNNTIEKINSFLIYYIFQFKKIKKKR